MHSQETLPLDSILIRLSSIDCFSSSQEWTSSSPHNDEHALFIVLNGQGNALLDNNRFLLAQGKSFLLTPGTSIDWQQTDKTLVIFRAVFTVIRTDIPGQYKAHEDRLLPCQPDVSIYPFFRLLRIAEELYDNRQTTDGLEWYHQQSRFQELMGHIFEYHLRTDRMTSSKKAVENSIQYMQQHYHESLTVKELAEAIAIAPSQYSSIFQALTGQKPLDYLTALRIAKAKELLDRSNEPLRTIANQVGFKDEYYFNRRFSQSTGITPKQYARMSFHRMRVKDWMGHEVDIPIAPKRVIYCGETLGDLLTLGISPIGFYTEGLSETIRENLKITYEAIDLPIDAEKSNLLNPDLIIFASANEREYSQISKIAPTLTFNSWGSLEERMLTLGEWLGKQQEAQSWLSQYQHRENLMWQQLNSLVKPGETASVILHDHGKRLFVMGATGLPASLYHPHGFQPVKRIQAMLDAGDGYKEISAQQLHLYTGDRLFVLLSSVEESRAATLDLMNSPLWSSLPAVCSGKVHIIEASFWNHGDAFTRERMLEALPRLLRQTS